MTDPSIDIVRLAATTRPRGGKLKHWREALPGLDDDTLQAIRAAAAVLNRLRLDRAEAHRGADPLLAARSARPYRTARATAAREAKSLRRRADAEAAIAATLAQQAKQRAIRESLLAAARVARSMGLTVRSSKSRAGTISSYYVARDHGPAIRISDHEIPETPQRLDAAMQHGRFSYDGYHGAELIVDRPRSHLWLRRALTLSLDGRAVPGA